MVVLHRLANRAGEMVEIDHHLADALLREELEEEAHHRSSAHGQGGLGTLVRERAQPRPETGGEDHRTHAALPAARSIAAAEAIVIELFPRRQYRSTRARL